MRSSKPRFLRTVLATIVILSFLGLTIRSHAFGASESVLWSFGNGTDGAFPFGGLIMDSSGNLYGTTFSGGKYGNVDKGTVFQLTPPATGGQNWKESILWSFGNGTDGNRPVAGLIIDTDRNLYGTTNGGGNNGAGTVFELTPPSTIGGDFAESILWSFGNGTDGKQPGAPLIMDTGGNLFGTTQEGGANGGGTVFELTPPLSSGANWTESILWSFGNGSDGSIPSNGGVIMDSGGNLYGITTSSGANGVGTVFELSPPISGGDWTESVLSSFSKGHADPSGLIMDKSGNLYGTTGFGGANGCPSAVPPKHPPRGGGTVFELSPPSMIGGNWDEKILWNFCMGKDGFHPDAGVIMDSSGNLYGTTSIGSIYVNKATAKGLGMMAFELTPPSTIGGNWTESILRTFGKFKDGNSPQAGLIMDSSGRLYSTTTYGGAFANTYSSGGTVFEIAAVLTAAPAQLNFANVAVGGTSTPKKVTLTNKGTLAALISSVTATAPFTIAGGANTCSGKTIAPKQSCSFAVEFAPTTVASVTGGIDVTYNGTSPVVALKGNGIAAR